MSRHLNKQSDGDSTIDTLLQQCMPASLFHDWRPWSPSEGEQKSDLNEILASTLQCDPPVLMINRSAVAVGDKRCSMMHAGVESPGLRSFQWKINRSHFGSSHFGLRILRRTTSYIQNCALKLAASIQRESSVIISNRPHPQSGLMTWRKSSRWIMSLRKESLHANQSHEFD